MKQKLTRAQILAVFAAGLLLSATTVASAQDRLRREIVVSPPGLAQSILEQRIERLQDMTLLNDLGQRQFEEITLGRFWIGLNCANVSDTLRSHLNLEEGHGLLVVEAYEDTPAQKAGLQQHDVIVKAGDQPLKSVKDLIDAVQKAETSELKLKVFRRGESIDVSVTPVERPEDQRGLKMRVLKGHGPGGAGAEGRFLFVEPGVVLPQPEHRLQLRNLVVRPNLPPGVSVTITRKGNERAKIHVERGDKSWDIDESEIDQLPEDLRPHVRGMLNPWHTSVVRPVQPEQWWRSLKDKVKEKVREKVAPEVPSPAPQFEGARPPKVEPSDAERIQNELIQQLKRLSERIDRLEKAESKEDGDDTPEEE